jgi:putative Ca2+/H+ antiporter (TMEM165/GDT1 family)
MVSIPPHQESFVSMVHSLFPNLRLLGIVIRTVNLTFGPPATIAYFKRSVSAADLEAYVLEPLARGSSVGDFCELVGSGRFPAPIVETVQDADSLCRGLILGLIAVHVNGSASAVLVGTAAANQPQTSFGPALVENLATLYHALPHADLKVKAGTAVQDNIYAAVYLQGIAPPETVQAVRSWAEQLSPQAMTKHWWQAALGAFRLPSVVRVQSPLTMALFLRRGYVAVFAEHLTEPLLGPASLSLLLASTGDIDISPALRRLVIWSRLMACQVSLTLGAVLIAFTSYHHGLIPGAFLMAMAATRQNMPFPTVLEMFFLAMLGDVAQAAALLIGGRRLGFLAWIASILAGMVLVQMGVVGSTSVTASIISLAVRDILPSQELRRVITVWRYLFMAAATALGIYGLTLMAYAFIVYLSDTDIFGQRLWAEPAPQAS